MLVIAELAMGTVEEKPRQISAMPDILIPDLLVDSVACLSLDHSAKTEIRRSVEPTGMGEEFQI